MEYTEEKQIEIKKLLKIIKQFEGILRTSANVDQKRRVSKDLHKYKQKLDELCPDGVPEEFTADPAKKETEPEDASSEFRVISKFDFDKASPHSEDNDVNVLATLTIVFEKEYWPALSDSHLKLDYSHSSERDSFYSLLETSKRNLKILVETIEEYATATKTDFREQLYKMKNKQTRIYLYETVSFYRKLRDFIKKLVDDIELEGNIITNKDDKISFQSQFETATLLDGYSISKLVNEAYVFLDETIGYLNLPELELKKER